ncbi:unnamed protein product [Adineta steineri]|uniref:J domain-containing protein n=1 Tax=Adineta steineri TaxID=433720 RepID=A0A815D4N7_9BILA|nr:unnamed protein product [Adineta steineri]CAF1292397.1 unnamed protein product [Adineta steineri]CAF1331301.1 unnamed protein product [Adineta steineri]
MVSNLPHVDYYKELGINRHATPTDIRTAYKRLALTWHPDRNKAKDAEDKFKKIKQAYDILIDDNQRREYDHRCQQLQQQQQQRQQQQKKNTYYGSATNMSYGQSKAEKENKPFNFPIFEQFISPPVDPFEIINDIQYFQDSDFTSKMMNSPSYRNLYTHLFNTMNNDSNHQRHVHSSSPIYFSNDHIFRQTPKTRSKPPPQQQQQQQQQPKRPSTKRFSANIPVIHSTMTNDWFVNELIDIYEHQNIVFVQPSFNNDPFFDDLSHCTICHKKISGDRTNLMQHEQQCQQNHNRYTTMPSTSVRV